MYFLKRNKNRMIVAVIAIILIIIIGTTSSNRSSLSKVEKLIGNILSPVEGFFYGIGSKTTDLLKSIGGVGNLKGENENLKIRIIELEEENRNYENLIAKSDYLRKEAELLKNTEHKLIAAQVTGKEPGNWFERFTIDKGKDHGIKKGDTVIQAIETDDKIVQEGMVGRIVEVGDTWSKVVSIIDDNSKISFQIIRTQDGGIISKNIDNQLEGYLFDIEADIMKEDKLLTSGLGGVFKKDVYIGEVTDVIEKDKDLVKRIEVEPAVDFKGIYKVFIISD